MYITKQLKDSLKVWESLSEKNRYFLGLENYYEKTNIVYRKILKNNIEPIVFLELGLCGFSDEVFLVVATNPKYRGKGYIKKLVKLAEEENKGKYKRFFWKTYTENENSVSAAYKLGYKPISSFHGTFSNFVKVFQ